MKKIVIKLCNIFWNFYNIMLQHIIVQTDICYDISFFFDTCCHIYFLWHILSHIYFVTYISTYIFSVKYVVTYIFCNISFHIWSFPRHILSHIFFCDICCHISAFGYIYCHITLFCWGIILCFFFLHQRFYMLQHIPHFLLSNIICNRFDKIKK